MNAVQLDLDHSRLPRPTAPQLLAILRDFEQGAWLTPLGALERHGCFRLAARVEELRSMGWPVVTTTVLTDNGKRIAAYHLAPF